VVRRRESRLPVVLVLLAGCVAGAAFVTLIEAPLPEEIVLGSLERAMGPAVTLAR
jgi:hypothetical protein